VQVEILRVVVAEDDDQLAELITSLLHEDARFEVVGRAHDAGASGFLHKDAITSGDLADALDVLHRNYLRRGDTVEG